MLNRVSLVDENRIIEEVEFDNERKLTSEEREKYGKQSVEMVGDKRGFVLINKAKLQQEANKYLQQPEAVQQMQGRDAFAVMLKSVLFHAYTHTIVSREEFSFESITIETEPPLVMDKIGHGFQLIGKDPDGGTVYLPGGHEGLTDYMANVIGEETGPYLSSYRAGNSLVNLLNRRAGVTIEQMKAYYRGGSRSKRELFRRWGAIKNSTHPSEQTGLVAFITVALRVDYPSVISQDYAIAKINELLTPDR